MDANLGAEATHRSRQLSTSIVIKSGAGRTQRYCAIEVLTRRFDVYRMPLDTPCSKDDVGYSGTGVGGDRGVVVAPEQPGLGVKRESLDLAVDGKIRSVVGLEDSII